MTKFDNELIDVFDGFVFDNDWFELFDIIFPGASPGEIILDMYNYGMIPNSTIETFLEETDDA
jgi:hypothetical protein